MATRRERDGAAPAAAVREDARPARLRGFRGLCYRGLLAGSLAAFAYVVAVAVVAVWFGVEVADPTRLRYPLAWLALSAAGLAAIGPSGVRPAPWALAAGAAYVAVLAFVSGHLVPGFPGLGFGAAVYGEVPGWGPVVIATFGIVEVTVVPFQAVGYLALGSLLAVALSTHAGSLLGGVVGLFSCVGCFVPVVLAAVPLAGLAGLAEFGIAGSTVAFALAVSALVGVVAVGNRDGRDRASCERCSTAGADSP